ncbi:MAG: hypothetical protein DRI80_10250, partial [Chloroflexota bacterium]
MVTIRLMREEDADAVRRVDAAAFGAWWRQLMGEAAELPQRTRRNVLALLEKDPEGCFVAEDDGRVVGLIFSRTWGGVGWFGTFAVLPECQGRGIGKRLIAASLEYLRWDTDRVIGLETMPESPYNLGLYLRQGFQARFPTFLLSKDLEPSAGGDVGIPCWSRADEGTRERWLAELREATGQIHPRLDYTKLFAPALGVPEDPATGSANGALGAYLVHHRVVPLTGPTVHIVSEQGAELGRPSTLYVEVDHTDGEVVAVRVGGQVVEVAEGTVRF